MKNNKDLELDLDHIESLGILRENENMRFRAYLKGQDIRKIDQIVHELNREISGRIDCTTCGNCCRKLKPCITDQDTRRLANRLNVSTEKIKSDYLEIDGAEKFFKNLPCTFLKDKKCSIYNDKPEDCNSYPHLHKKDFIFRLFGVIENYSICPIVFNVFERLKKELNFR